MQTKKASDVSREFPQTLACMVGVQQHRIDSGCEAGTVDGAIIDGMYWHFLRLDGRTLQTSSVYMSSLSKDRFIIPRYLDVIFKTTISASMTDINNMDVLLRGSVQLFRIWILLDAVCSSKMSLKVTAYGANSVRYQLKVCPG